MKKRSKGGRCCSQSQGDLTAKNSSVHLMEPRRKYVIFMLHATVIPLECFILIYSDW